MQICRYLQYMNKELRFEYILNKLDKKQQLTYAWVAKKLDISEDTIRRDIDYLAQNGLLSKIRGGATLLSQNPLTFQGRNQFLKKEKDVIALKVLPFIKEGDTLFMDGGTTICAIAAYLPMNISLRIVTNNQMLLPILSKHKNIELIILGGTYNHKLEITTGNVTITQIKDYVVDLFIMGTCAIDSKIGITASHYEESELKKSMISSSRKTIALVNHKAINDKAAFRVCEMDLIDTIITDLSSNDHKLDDFRFSSIKIV